MKGDSERVIDRREFSAYARKAVDRLTRSMAQTSNAVQSNKWLAGARIIYEAVKLKRSALGLDTKPFAKWAGLELDVEQIVAGLFKYNRLWIFGLYGAKQIYFTYLLASISKDYLDHLHFELASYSIIVSMWIIHQCEYVNHQCQHAKRFVELHDVWQFHVRVRPIRSFLWSNCTHFFANITKI